MPSAARAEPIRSGVAVDSAPDCKASPSPDAIPRTDTCFVSWVSSFLGFVWSSRSGLGSFLRLSSRAPACTALPDERSGDVWPVPLPVACWTADAKCKLSPKRRRKARHLRLAGELLRLQVGTLNWLALGCPTVPPDRACTRGAALSRDQLNVLDTLERHCRYFLRAGPFNLSSLGRSGEKFANLLRASELSQADTSGACDVDRLLSEFVCALQSDWCPYGPRPRTPNASTPTCPPQDASRPDAAAAACHPGSLGFSSVGSGLSCKPVISDRIKWSLPPSFDPMPFLLDPDIKRAYADPSSVKLPAEMWPKLPRSKVHASRSELLRLAAKWDEHKALRIFRCCDVDRSETVGCFGVPKDESYDRFILNPSVINARSRKLSLYTKLLAPGCLLAQATLPSDAHVMRVCCDDLSEMYYTFHVPEQRAKRNCLGMVFSPSELCGFNAFNPSRHYGPCYIALGALAMGDCGAVEYAQQSHFNVLLSLGNCMRPNEFVAYRRAFPRSSCLEFLSIDDHMTAQVCSKTQLKLQSPLRDTAIFKCSDAAYPAVGLVSHPGKRKRNTTAGVFLGAELDGIEGIVSAPRHRIGVLMKITSLIARRACASASLLASVLGLWVHALLFRRPVFAVLSQVFVDARRVPANEVFTLHRDSVNELFSLCALAPLLQADLRTTYPGALFAMDASPTGAGLCSAVLPPHVVQELWRHSEQKGFYTRLLDPAAALLCDLGLSSDAGSAFVEDLTFSTVSPFDPEPLPLRPPLCGDVNFLCLFCNSEHWVPSFSRAGLVDFSATEPWLSGLPFSALGDASTFRRLCEIALSGRVHDWHVSPPWDMTHRSEADPCGFVGGHSETFVENTLARRLCFLLCLVASAGSYVSVAQPSASTLFRLHCFRGFVSFGAALTKLHLCAFGSPCCQTVVFLHNKPWLCNLGGSRCACSCEPAAPRFPAVGRFTDASRSVFSCLCRPSASALFGREPSCGERVDSFCSLFPSPFVARVASGSSLAATGYTVPLPASSSLRALHSLGFLGLGPFPLVLEACSRDVRLFHDDPEWIGELADCLNFREDLRYKFKGPGHINVLEARAYKTWLKICARRYPNSRPVGLIDSRVLLGCAAKGRSASPALCRVLRSALPYVLGSGLYPGGLHVYSAQNRADGPSRSHPPLPASKAWPRWLSSLAAGDYRPFDLVRASASVPRVQGRWLRLLLLLAGDVERNPGPFHDGAPRGALDLQGGFASSTRHKMDKALSAFAVWLRGSFGLELEAVLSSASSAALALRAFGLYLYSSGQPRYLLVYAITSVQDSHPQYRTQLAPAWQVDRKWQQAEPGECRPVISQPIIQAAVALALCWGWHDWACLTLIGFLCMLHPAEMLSLTRQDLVFPEDALSPDPVAYVHIRSPKTHRFAQRQHSRLEDPLVLQMLQALYSDLPLASRLFRGSMHTYRRQWNSVMSRLGVPHRLSERGATPGVLRGSGATFLYLETEDLPLVAWRGRWSKTKTIEFYLQEVAAQLLLQRLPRWARERIKLLSKFSRALILHLLQECGKCQGN